MCELIEKYFIAFAGPILTLSFGGYITWRIYTKKRFIEAADKFRSTVFTELEGLYPTPAKWPDNGFQIVQILKDKFPRLEIAVTEFRSHLSRFKRKSFDEAWLKYNKEYYYDYVPIKGHETDERGVVVYSHDNTATYKDNFKHNIDVLLTFAKHTW